ncbi:gluzincin family metallopeptidase [Mucilaginibacter xinganensis]|uniref:Uncharacterized protein n=1 Tax=Mucilaginibacter xinganensis TaxID=1234841 RepID=A0A223NTM9_9SPHI|nr:hypothetical protein [Mucilaginibacter xinganensis]ASU33034.1 hypothetical protein MuYL_1134 [Mucilaginibacter xinganensis]
METTAITRKKKGGKTKHPKQPAGTINAWEQDPGSGNQPDGGQLIQEPAPDMSATSLPTAIKNPAKAPAAGVYTPGTAEFRYWAAAASLSRGSAFWSVQLPGISWEVGKTLPVDLDHGSDLNAYYDRVGLRFFHGIVGTRTFYSGESPDVINHEQGHAVLDALKPQLWNAANLEVPAFHESFGDMSAILCAMQVPSLRHGVLAETGGSLYKSSRLSRLAEQLGWAIRQSDPSDVDADCLRNAVNSFFYRPPHTLPTYAPASALSSEPHSFSRVFTSAFFEGMANMFHITTNKDEADLLQVSVDMGKILVAGITAAKVVSAFYSQVAAHMVSAANALFPNIAYGQALKSSFIRHGIISVASSAALAKLKMTAAAAKTMTAAKDKSKDVDRMRLHVAEYDLGMDSILVHGVSEPKSFAIAGATLNVGMVTPQTDDEAAKSFFEDLLRRGRLRVVKNNVAMSPVVRPGLSETHHESHTHELQQEGSEYVLKRVRIDCGPWCGH